MKELEKTYNPADIEERLYQKWLDNKYFHADAERGKREGKKPFTIVMPPPNITGQLHMGHALDNTMQDILIRYKRMQGYNALWVPGTDHAGIATQIKVEEALRVNEGLTRYDLGREKFLELVWDWKNKYGSYILDQIKKQLAKLEDVREIKELPPSQSVSRELILVKVAATPAERQSVISIADIFRAKIVDVAADSLMIELTGNEAKLVAFIELLQGYTIKEIARTGITGLSRGAGDMGEYIDD